MVLSRFVKMLLAQSVVAFPGVFGHFLATVAAAVI
jgi:hypothetical protein